MKTKIKGQALTEFALILPLLLLLVLGIIEGALIIRAYITVQNAAREAARYAVTGQPFDDTGNPWALGAERIGGCDPSLQNAQLGYTGCDGPNDRVDAITGVALQGAAQTLAIERPAIYPGIYTATGYIDQGGTYGVRVIGQEFGNDARIDYAGKEGLNVLVQVYYNMRLLDPLYAAIIPGGFVHLEGEVQMQNEGIDTALGNVPPGGIAPPEAPEGGTYGGSPNPPVISSLDGSDTEAGSDFRVRLEYHNPGQKYDVYFYSASLDSVAICSGGTALEADNFGSKEGTCYVPPSTTPGTYQLVSVEQGLDGDNPANHVAKGEFITVAYPGQPLLTIVDRNQWPPGSTITFQLFGHQPCPPTKQPCPPFQEYDIALIGGIFGPAPGQVIPPPVEVDAFGSGSKVWTIPSNLAAGTYAVNTYRKDETTDPVASTVLKIVPAQIVIQGGNEWPAGTTIRVHLRGHVPDRTYTLRWTNSGTGQTIDFGPITVDQFGNTLAPLSFRIPESTANGTHSIVSFETGGDGSEVASTSVVVETPEEPFITVVGGNEWPAGSLIQIELHKHVGGPYNLYFRDQETLEDTLIESDINPGASGLYQTTYVIPIATLKGSYDIWTEQDSDPDVVVATYEIEVTSVPLIRLREGAMVQPGAEVTIEIVQHAPNDSFEIYLDGNFLFNLPTDAIGAGRQVYDLSIIGLEGGPFVLESRQGGTTVASTEIYIVAPDLKVTNIEFPPGPPVNQEIPVTVTVFNDSPVAISGEYFDVDLYLDPLHTPTTGSQFPPGDYKRWVDSLPPTSTVQVVFNLTLRGTDHTVYGRADTSDYIDETNEINNIYQTAVSGPCVSQITNALENTGNWTGVGYGDADQGAFSLGGGVINLESDGSGTFGSSDNMYLVYYTPQTISGDFEVRVHMRNGPVQFKWASAGLEIRDSVDSASSAKVDLAVARSADNGAFPAVQASYRDGGSTRRPDDASTDRQVAYPVWLRIVRSGDRFIYYYSDSDSDAPPADSAWTQHGSVQMTNMGDAVTIGFFNASTSQDDALDRSSFDKLHLCLKDVAAPPAGEDFPPGLTVCSGNLIQNGGFEGDQLAPWGKSGFEVNMHPDEYEGTRSILLNTYISPEHYQPQLWQTFDMPEWIISDTTTMNLSLYKCVLDIGSGRENTDLSAGLQTTGGITITDSVPTVTDGGDPANAACSSGKYRAYSTDLAVGIEASGGNPEDYAGQTLKLYFYDFNNDLGICRPPGGLTNPDCYEIGYHMDNVELEVCTTQPIPDPESGKVTIGGPLRVFIGGAPQPKQGVRVWTYKQNGDLLTTYSLHDSNYFFYNVDPGKYVIYSEYWDGPNLYSAFTTVTVVAGETRTDLSLLLR